MLDLLHLWTPAERVTTVDRIGWTDERFSSFVLGDGKVMGAASVFYQPIQPSALAAGFATRGGLDDWKSLVAAGPWT